MSAGEGGVSTGTPDPAVTRQPAVWSPAQIAALAAAEAVACLAAADVATEAAATARAAVEVASVAADKAAAKARDVAAEAVTVAAAVAAVGADVPPTDAIDHVGTVGPESALSATAAEKVAETVASVAAAAATAVIDAATLIDEQLARDVEDTAIAVTAASGTTETSPPSIVPHPRPRYRAHVGDLHLAEELRVGIDAGQLRLHYQPIIDLATGQAVSAEALVRWEHPDRGLLGAQDFIELAERDALIIRLGAWVLDEACRAAVLLQNRGGGGVTVSVNLSARQLSDGRIIDTVRTALDKHGCSGDRLVFELTETAPVTDMDAAVASLRGLKELGASLAIDDFGTGYSTLQYLGELPVDVLKIDRTFIAALDRSPDDASLVESVISLAHNVNVQCVAEGVETDAQLGTLEQAGCDFAQGYLFSHPVDETALNAWLDDRVRTRDARAGRRFSPETARILDMCEHGSSYHTVAAALNADGSRTADHRRWSAESVAQIVERVHRGDHKRPA
jgi:EAL domain-containing protein (putative c-di-GMP-specific phosphodiesterase class I)